jgi:hypothetical protein
MAAANCRDGSDDSPFAGGRLRPRPPALAWHISHSALIPRALDEACIFPA